MERLSGLDSAFLSLETPSSHLHVAIAATIDTSTMAVPYSFERLVTIAERRLLPHAGFRRRLVEVPLGLDHPLWIDDPRLDIRRHVHRHVLPPPGSDRELGVLCSEIMGTPLDRSRPLWEMHVIEGLADGAVGLVGKIHHAAVDGVSGAELFAHLFDLTPDARVDDADRPLVAPGASERPPSPVGLAGRTLASQVRRSLSLPGLLGRTAGTAAQLVARHREQVDPVGAVPLRAPRTPWSAPLTPRRSVAFARVPLAAVTRVRQAFGVTLNDVVLALVSGALRRYLAERAALPEEPLVALCPVSVRGADQRGRHDNRVSAMWVHLRTDIDDVVERLRGSAASAQGAKRDHAALGHAFVQRWADQPPPGALSVAAGLHSRLGLAGVHPPVHNLVVSNVPGPDITLYLDGARLVRAHPLGPVMDGAGLNVTVLSYTDHIDVGLLAGADLVPDLWDVAAHLDAATAELVAAAEAHERRPAPVRARRRATSGSTSTATGAATRATRRAGTRAATRTNGRGTRPEPAAATPPASPPERVLVGAGAGEAGSSA